MNDIIIQNDIHIEQLTSEIKKLEKAIYSRKYHELVLRTGYKQFDVLDIKYKNTKAGSTFSATLVYAPFLYILGYIDYVPRDDAFGLVVFKKMKNKWVWEYSYLGSTMYKVISKTKSEYTHTEIHFKKNRSTVNTRSRLSEASVKKLRELENCSEVIFCE